MFVYTLSILLGIFFIFLSTILYTIYYGSADTRSSLIQFIPSPMGIIALILLATGFAIFASTTGLLFSEHTYKKRRAYLIEHGIQHKAVVVDIITNGMRGTTEFHVVAKKISDSEDTYTTYTSDPIAYTPDHIVQKGDSIFIYEDPKNHQKYIIDTDSLFK